ESGRGRATASRWLALIGSPSTRAPTVREAPSGRAPLASGYPNADLQFGAPASLRRRFTDGPAPEGFAKGLYGVRRDRSGDWRLVEVQPVAADLLNSVHQFGEIHRLADVAVSPQAIAAQHILIFA